MNENLIVKAVRSLEIYRGRGPILNERIPTWHADTQSLHSVDRPITIFFMCAMRYHLTLTVILQLFFFSYCIATCFV